MEGRKVYLELDQTPFDGYGRLLAYVYLDGQGHFMVNLALATSPLFRALPSTIPLRYNPCFLRPTWIRGRARYARGSAWPRNRRPGTTGKEIRVCGVVAGVSRLAYNRMFLNFGRPYPNQI
ncbi:MAG: hypothetical protein ABDI20_06490, partial [Candidatus Bipolaricaulaceae bacterium]